MLCITFCGICYKLAAESCESVFLNGISTRRNFVLCLTQLHILFGMIYVAEYYTSCYTGALNFTWSFAEPGKPPYITIKQDNVCLVVSFSIHAF